MDGVKTACLRITILLALWIRNRSTDVARSAKSCFLTETLMRAPSGRMTSYSLKVLSPDADPDPDHIRGGPGQGYNTFCVK